MRRTRSRTTTCRAACLALILLSGRALAPWGAAAQQQTEAQAARAVAEAVRLYNAPSSARLAGAATIPAAASVRGDVAALGGPLTIAGTVDGRVAVINGDLVLLPGARVTGDIVVAGGRIQGADVASVGGTVTESRDPVDFRREGDRLVVQPRRAAPLSAGRRFGFGRTEFNLGVRGAYNRVEGLPIAIGPRLELGRANPTVLDAQAIYRTRSGLGFRPNEFGYVVRLEQYLGGHRTIRVGGALRSEIVPIEATGLSDLESSLAAFVLHRSYRDSYERHGWSGYVVLTSRSRPWQLTLEYVDEDHGSEAPREPWALRHNDEPWRPQPLVAEGDLRSVVASFSLDTRNDRRMPSAGWLMDVSVEQGVGGEMTLFQPAVPLDPTSALIPTGVDEEYTWFNVDARRYVRIDPRQRLALRVLAGGSVDGRHLPPQRQRVLGGEGLMPGFPAFNFDCGARRVPVLRDGEPFYPAYGCDRAALAQLQYSLTFPIVPGIGRRLGLDLDFGDAAELVLFAGAGRAWSEDASATRTTGTDDVVADAGIGLALGQLGIYWAHSITGGGKGINFFLRLAPRI